MWTLTPFWSNTIQCNDTEFINNLPTQDLSQKIAIKLLKRLILTKGKSHKSNLQETAGVYQQMFGNTILKLQWFDKNTNEDLWERARQRPVEQELRYRKWRWLGHTLRRARQRPVEQELRYRK
jgi:hypothetical protein